MVAMGLVLKIFRQIDDKKVGLFRHATRQNLLEVLVHVDRSSEMTSNLRHPHETLVKNRP
jgi:hypothetical protein